MKLNHASVSHLAESVGLSDPQRAVISDDACRLLVAAGAGSGKTRLLVTYFVHALLLEEVPLDRMVAVTFTRKAAAELVARIRSTLQGCGRPDLACRLETANVGTIHSLCSRLLRDHAVDAGVDPAFRVIDAQAATLVKEEVCSEVWARAVEEADDAALAMLAYEGGFLRTEIIPLYERLRAGGCERPCVTIPEGPSEDEARSALSVAVQSALVAGSRLASPSAAVRSDLSLLQRCLEWLGNRTVGEARGTAPAGRLAPPPAGTVDAGAELSLTGTFFPSRRTRAMEQFFVPVREALTLYRESLAGAWLRPMVNTMNDLLSRFHEGYEVFKRERSLLDFADLELRARALVLGLGDAQEAVRRPPLRVVADEFQDTNELQCSILEGLGASRLLMVGDDRQSIYRFRGADVEVFRRREKLLGSTRGGNHPRGKDCAGGVHRLTVNYRSGPEVLSFVNRVFADSRFFGPAFSPLEQGRTDDRAGSPRAGVVEVVVAERQAQDGTGGHTLPMQEAEALAVACRVRSLVDDEGWEPRQIAVLTPAQTHIAVYQRALLARAVDVYVVGGRGYFSREEVSDVTALLRLLVNPHDDLALVTVLRSPLVEFSDDGLYFLGRETKERRASSLWETVRGGELPRLCDSDKGRLVALTELLAGLRCRIGRPGLAGLIEEAVTAFGYDLCLLASPEGKRRFANVRKLMHMAEEYEALEGPDLGGFVTAIRSLGDLWDREGSAATLAEGENVVRVMTVHQAKGLEFPVVVLAGLGSEVPPVSRTEFVVDDDGRMGVFLKGSQRAGYEKHDLCLGPAAEIVAEQRARSREEDVRLLYVAVTRAQDRLVLVGARPPSGKVDERRIGRLCRALGLEALPGPDTSLLVPVLGTVVTAVTPSSGGDEKPRELDVPIGPQEHRQTQISPRFAGEFVLTTVPRMSFSALDSYRRCPHRFYLERVLGLGPSAPPPIAATVSGLTDQGPVDLKTSSPAGAGPPIVEWGDDLVDDSLVDDSESRTGRETGLLVHFLLAESVCAEKRPTHRALMSKASEWLRLAGLCLPEAELDRALSLTLAFWRSPFASEKALAYAHRETPFVFSHGGVTISGVLDLTWQDDGTRRIVDYKTNGLGGRSTAEVASGYELQAAIYCVAALRAGASTALMDFLFLERPEEPVPFSYRREHLPCVEQMLDRALDGVRKGRFPAHTGNQCVTCPVCDMCARGSPLSHGIQ